MSTDYEAPEIAELGDFTEETGHGIGLRFEGWVPIHDYS
ncbi:lasso RiPP family leader peptide-containing protein [Streptomyces caeruleatus]|nr:lasso RiPP family leader peptide-containing protein [Streptomyces caeruleatus]